MSDEREAWLAMDARRRERKRAQWRESKARAYAMLREHGLVGFLHSVGCQQRYHKGTRKCRPIPMYDHPVR